MESTSTSGADAGRPIRLLVVDDDEGIRTLLEVTISLDPRFALVGSASNAADALAALERCIGDGCPDVVLLDVTLPDRDGIELVGDLRAVSPDVRVALFTGWSDDETIARAEAAGADAVFAKDGDPRGLLDGLARLAASVD
ncbi:MAG: putative two-component system response regulator [Thermoleophilia bacterium]|nr:putative two-component system response regulator [Thermoleophilia bacterium]